jgi:hypothetical protein
MIAEEEEEEPPAAPRSSPPSPRPTGLASLDEGDGTSGPAEAAAAVPFFSLPASDEELTSDEAEALSVNLDSARNALGRGSISRSSSSGSFEDDAFGRTIMN